MCVHKIIQIEFRIKKHFSLWCNQVKNYESQFFVRSKKQRMKNVNLSINKPSRVDPTSEVLETMNVVLVLIPICF